MLNRPFILVQTPYQKGLGVRESKQEVTKVVSIVKSNGKSIKCVRALNPCHAELIKMPRTLLIVSQSDSLIQIFI